MIKVVNLRKKYIREYYALFDVSLEVADGEKVALVGAENSGKTSLLRILAKVEKFDKGEVYIKNIPIKKLNYSTDISAGYLPATPVFFEKKTVYENLKYILKLKKLSEAEIENKINEALIEFSIEGIKDSLVKELSLYEKYLVSIVRLSFRELSLVYIDDIFSKLREEDSEKILGLIKQLFLQKGLTVLLATQDESIADLMDREIYFENGIIVDKAQ